MRTKAPCLSLLPRVPGVVVTFVSSSIPHGFQSCLFSLSINYYKNDPKFLLGSRPSRVFQHSVREETGTDFSHSRREWPQGPGEDRAMMDWGPQAARTASPVPGVDEQVSGNPGVSVCRGVGEASSQSLVTHSVPWNPGTSSSWENRLRLCGGSSWLPGHLRKPSGRPQHSEVSIPVHRPAVPGPAAETPSEVRPPAQRGPPGSAAAAWLPGHSCSA